MNADLTEALERIAALAEAAGVGAPHWEAQVTQTWSGDSVHWGVAVEAAFQADAHDRRDFIAHVNPAHLLEVVGMVRAELAEGVDLLMARVTDVQRLAKERSEMVAKVQRLTEEAAEDRAEHHILLRADAALVDAGQVSDDIVGGIKRLTKERDAALRELSETVTHEEAGELSDAWEAMKAERGRLRGLVRESLGLAEILADEGNYYGILRKEIHNLRVRAGLGPDPNEGRSETQGEAGDGA